MSMVLLHLSKMTKKGAEIGVVGYPLNRNSDSCGHSDDKHVLSDPNLLGGFLHGENSPASHDRLLGLEGCTPSESDVHQHSEGYAPSVGDVSAVTPALSAGYDADAVLDSAWKSLQSSSLKHFWEDTFWESLLDDRVQPADIMTNALKRPLPVLFIGEEKQVEPVEQRIAKRIAVTEGPAFLRVVRDTTEQSWQEEREAKWEISIRRWVALIDSWNDTSKIASLIQGKTEFVDKAQILVDVFFNKSPQTLAKRVNSLGRITNHFLGLGKSFPCDECEFYNFLKLEASRMAPVSRLKGYYEAITFARHVLNVESLQDILDSRRCLGAASTSVIRFPNQAKPFTVKQLLQIHHELETSTDVWTKNMCGMILCCTYARARWSDAQHAERLVEDVGEDGTLCYLEIQSTMHKTCRALHMRDTFLPMTAPAKGVSEIPWGPLWLDARRELGISDIKKFPLMPAPAKDLSPTVRPLSTTEANGWFRILLQLGDQTESGKVTTHSCKCACLSFLAKRGVSIEDRLCLGYHSNPMRMALVYSRDASSRPLALLERLLEEIRLGIFQPDNTRSGRLQTGTQELSAGAMDLGVDSRNAANICKVENASLYDGVITVDSSSDDGHVTTSSSESSGDERCVVTPVVGHRAVDIPDTHVIWRNDSSKMFHLSLTGYQNVLCCGRRVSSNVVRFEGSLRFDSCKCKQCFRQLKR